LVEANISLAKPICAAAHLVAVNDVDAAIQVLLLCGGMRYFSPAIFSLLIPVRL
jgi:hypothetical protein